MTSRWKWTQTFEITIRHNLRLPINPLDMAVAVKNLTTIDPSATNIIIKEAKPQ